MLAPAADRERWADCAASIDKEAHARLLGPVNLYEGKNLVVERRSAEGRTGRYPEFTREVVQLRPDVICASSTQLVAAFKATTTISIVGLMYDPVDYGLVRSLPRPGGNITGFSVMRARRSLSSTSNCFVRPLLKVRASPSSSGARRERAGKDRGCSRRPSVQG